MEFVEDTQRYLENFYEPKFTEVQFVRLLLMLLYKKGITEIDEDELSKKLYYYYIRPEYKELFEEIHLSQSMSCLDCDGKVDIYDGIYHQKYFTKSIWWDSMRSSPLHLRYIEDIQESYYGKLSEKDVLKMQQLVDELSNSLKVEAKSRYPLRICAMNPNKNYNLCHGFRYYSIYSWELLTDGNILNIEKDYQDKIADELYVDSPVELNTGVKLKNNDFTKVEIKDASYVVMQGLSDSCIKRLKIYTMQTEYDILEKIRMIAEDYYDKEDSEILFKDKVSIKKIILK